MSGALWIKGVLCYDVTGLNKADLSGIAYMEEDLEQEWGEIVSSNTMWEKLLVSLVYYGAGGNLFAIEEREGRGDSTSLA